MTMDIQNKTYPSQSQSETGILEGWAQVDGTDLLLKLYNEVVKPATDWESAVYVTGIVLKLVNDDALIDASDHMDAHRHLYLDFALSLRALIRAEYRRRTTVSWNTPINAKFADQALPSAAVADQALHNAEYFMRKWFERPPEKTGGKHG